MVHGTNAVTLKAKSKLRSPVSLSLEAVEAAHSITGVVEGPRQSHC